MEFMNSLADWVVENQMLPNFNTQELANTVWAYATLDCTHVPLMEAVADAAIAQKVLAAPAPAFLFVHATRYVMAKIVPSLC